MSIPRLIFDFEETAYADIKYRKFMYFSTITNQVETEYDFHILREETIYGLFRNKKKKGWVPLLQTPFVELGMEHAIDFLQKHEYPKIQQI